MGGSAKVWQVCPTQQEFKRDSKQDGNPAAPIRILKLRTGYKIPKKESSTTPTDLEKGEIITPDANTPQPLTSNQLCKNKRARDESPATKLRRAIELLERADQLEQQARLLREKAKDIRPRYDRTTGYDRTLRVNNKRGKCDEFVNIIDILTWHRQSDI